MPNTWFLSGDRYQAGNHHVICDICSISWRRSDIRRRWDNLLACPRCWEPRHPQLDVRGRNESIAASPIRNDDVEVEVATNEVTRDDL